MLNNIPFFTRYCTLDLNFIDINLKTKTPSPQVKLIFHEETI